ncbi:Diguanylate cyclase [Rhodovastum atsumiense]|nr:diguanylate cyclase [Rhodovastum atsumiense]CAH2603526.1 Diguanylate cyclase [Rhodovastum atsumiense]
MLAHPPDIPTMLGAIILTSLALAVSLGWTARDNRDGLRTWTQALCLTAGGCLMHALRGTIPDWAPILLGNALLSLSLSLGLRAACRFHGVQENPWAAFLPPCILVVGLALLMDDFRYRVVLASLVNLVQVGLIARQLLLGRYDFPTRGRNMLLASGAFDILLAVGRCWGAIFLPHDFQTFFQPSPLQLAAYFSAFLLLIMATNGFMMMAKDRSDARLRQLAMRDRLTGCWNRVRIEEAAGQEMDRLRRYAHPACVILVDLDHFKNVNDRHGHEAGDAVLRDFAQIARECIRATDILGRWGGEEFIVILPMSDLPEALVIAERMRRCIERHIFPQGLRITISLGVAACLATDTWTDWFRRADAALYRAKAGGRNKIQIEGFDPPSLPANDSRHYVSQLVWREDYLCGEPEIDAQHRRLFEQGNALLALAGRTSPPGEILAATRALIAGTCAHFATEDRILAAAGYAGAAEHARIHRDLLARGETLLQAYGRGEIEPAQIFHFVLHDMFANHILVHDRQFSTCFAPSPLLEPAQHSSSQPLPRA